MCVAYVCGVCGKHPCEKNNAIGQSAPTTEGVGGGGGFEPPNARSNRDADTVRDLVCEWQSDVGVGEGLGGGGEGELGEARHAALVARAQQRARGGVELASRGAARHRRGDFAGKAFEGGETSDGGGAGEERTPALLHAHAQG